MIGTVMSNATEKKKVLNKKKCNLLIEEIYFLPNLRRRESKTIH